MLERKFTTITGLCVASLILFLLSMPGIHAQPETHLCPADRPCITRLFQDGPTVNVGWTGHGNFDHYNFRWNRPGRAETQHEVGGGRSGSFLIQNVHAGKRYTVKVQGCNTNFFGESTCTPWFEDSIVTRTDLHPDTCKVGFVWREARPQDHVCVPPQTRTETASDNQLAPSRRSPTGGDFGLDTCKQGFVWREAFPNDHVCVVPRTRTQAAEDNRMGPSRRLL